MGCSRRLMNSLSSVMLRLPSLSSPTVASSMSSAVALGTQTPSTFFFLSLRFFAFLQLLRLFSFLGVLIFPPCFHRLLKVHILLLINWSVLVFFFRGFYFINFLMFVAFLSLWFLCLICRALSRMCCLFMVLSLQICFHLPYNFPLFFLYGLRFMIFGRVFIGKQLLSSRSFWFKILAWRFEVIQIILLYYIFIIVEF